MENGWREGAQSGGVGAAGAAGASVAGSGLSGAGAAGVGLGDGLGAAGAGLNGAAGTAGGASVGGAGAGLDGAGAAGAAGGAGMGLGSRVGAGVGGAGADLGGAEDTGSAVSSEALRMKAQALLSQAEAIRAVSGVDVMALFDTDVDVRGRVLSGEWDFVDVWRETGMRAAPPAPVRAPNGGGMGGMDIGRMDSRQFEKLDTVLRQGGTLDMRW